MPGLSVYMVLTDISASLTPGPAPTGAAMAAPLQKNVLIKTSQPTALALRTMYVRSKQIFIEARSTTICRPTSECMTYREHFNTDLHA